MLGAGSICCFDPVGTCFSSKGHIFNPVGPKLYLLDDQSENDEFYLASKINEILPFGPRAAEQVFHTNQFSFKHTIFSPLNCNSRG